ncbi:site-specific DNA-methyltransferase [Seohaeicola saemankumensis]|uniref:site-specific DNA-methyltransferase n=1 Tax=Seohaeicola saemankumensis TaxID=481181 RepID=UPI001E28BBE6|nr:site-specific DNA-methyltransferase [Seohaeicola saemankumensis]MCD1628187.1 site-specific DNA-methyltransferase [Seohaeicola saemankumensis]
MARPPKTSPQVTTYAHDDRRVMNPEVGLVKPENDPDGGRAAWSYDPHIDPALQFDMGRAQIESLIDDALASGDSDKMRDALKELKRMQAPYLNWAGKAERTSFEIETVSLHVHERIDPATILEGIKKRMADGGMAEDQLDFFHPAFENKPLREALGFYKHDKDWSNRLISGDSLLVMNSLLQKESMRGQVQMIYIDPPYGIKYGSNFQPFTNKQPNKSTDKDEDLTQEPEMIKAFRDTWELGIHSYLTYLRDRLMLARELLSESGSVFVQISDENLHLVRQLLSEVFGPKNSMSLISYSTTGGFASSGLSRTGDYILWYAKDKEQVKFNRLYLAKDKKEAARGDYDQAIFANGSRGALPKDQRAGLEPIPEGTKIFTDDNPTSQGEGAATENWEWYGMKFHPGSGNHWKAPVPHGMRRLTRANRFMITPRGKLRYIRFFSDFDQVPVTDTWFDIAGAVQDRSDPKVYVVQTSNKIIERCLLMTTDPGDLVLDPTCGSGTTAYAAEKWGRRWITCDTSRVAVSLAKQRLMTASFDYFQLRYPHEGLKGGFDYKTTPRVMLGQIANNPDIDAIYDEEHPKIASALDNLNAALLASPPNAIIPLQGARRGKKVRFNDGDKLHEWEVPFEWPEDWPETAKSAFNVFHSARRTMQTRIDQSIAGNSNQETLYDQPHLDKTKLRVTGKFTVEAVPAPVVMGLEEAEAIGEPDDSIARSGATSRQATWRDELLKTGIRGKGGQMIEFADLEVIPGLKNLHASGSLAESGDRVVVSFGPEHAALEQRQVELALQEAEKLRPAPKVVVFCAFTFDPEAAKDIDELNWPGVTLLKAQMNTDLLTEDLKKKRASNQSFWLMGQPDVDLRKRKDGKWEVEVNGFDYFNTKTGELDSGGKSKIAMWSLDTDYNERSLFPHQIFFPMAGAKDGWNRLKATIRAELDEDMLDQFHGTVSLPFEAGENTKVAVKIVDDRGIESLKIIALDD